MLESAATLDLPAARVAVCGDWHHNHGWVRALARSLRQIAPDVTTILHTGDWWMEPDWSDRILADSGIERVIVTLGNHEPWGHITGALNAHPGEAVRVSETTWLLPRPFRFRVGGRGILSLGGASSLDRSLRTEGRDWWPEEAITDAQVAAAIADDPADVMLTHEPPDGTPVHAIRQLLRTNPRGFPSDALLASAASRRRVTQVWDAVRPALLVPGHMHVAGSGVTRDARRVMSLGRDAHEGNVVILDLRTLSIETPSLRQIREAARQG